jgi:hypothetical protein
MATALAVLAPPLDAGIEHCFPGHIVGNFVVDKNVDHDFRAFPFTVKRCSKRRKNASAGVTEEWDVSLNPNQPSPISHALSNE